MRLSCRQIIQKITILNHLRYSEKTNIKKYVAEYTWKEEVQICF